MDRLPPFDPATVYGTVPRRFARKASRDKPAAKVGDPMTGSLYDLFNRSCPFRPAFDGLTPTLQCLLRRVESLWTGDKDKGRYAVLWKCDAGASCYRYPFPFPVHNAVWSAYFAKGNWPGEAPVVELPLPVLGRVKLRLKRGPEFGRQLAQLRQLIDGSAKRGEAAVYRDRKGHLLVKLVGHFPRRDRGPCDNVAFVHTDPGALLVVEINGRPANVTNADHIRREIAKHKSMLRRTSEDKKREVRMDRGQRKNLNKHVATRCGKQNDRLDTYVQQVARQVANVCDRRRVGLVCYDDANKAFVPEGFPWHALKTRLQQLLGGKPPGEEPTGELGCGWIDGQYAHLGSFEEKDEWLRKARAALSAARRVAAHKSRPPRKSHPAVSRRRAI